MRPKLGAILRFQGVNVPYIAEYNLSNDAITVTSGEVSLSVNREDVDGVIFLLKKTAKMATKK